MDTEEIATAIAKEYKAQTKCVNFLGDVKDQMVKCLPAILKVLKENGMLADPDVKENVVAEPEVKEPEVVVLPVPEVKLYVENHQDQEKQQLPPDHKLTFKTAKIYVFRKLALVLKKLADRLYVENHHEDPRAT